MGIPLLVSMLVICGNSAFSQKKKKKDAEPLDQADIRAAEFYFIEGEKYFILEDYAKAIEAFQKSLDIDPENHVVDYKIAEIMFLSEEFSKAEDAIRSALLKNKDNKYYYLLASDIYSAQGKYEQSAFMYEEMINRIPNTDDYYIELAGIYLYQNNLDEALRVYNEVEEKFGIVDRISLQKQQIYLRQNNIEGAINEGKSLVTYYPGEPRYVVALAEVMNSNDRRQDAIVELENYNNTYGNTGQIDLRLAEFYRQEKRIEESTLLIKSSFSDTSIPVEYKVQILVGYISRFPDSYSKKIAEELGQILLENYPLNGDVLLVNADMIAKLISYNPENANDLRSSAALYYSQSLKLMPDNFSVWQNLLSLDLELSRWDSLAIHSEKALEYFPNQASTYWYAGIGNTQQKNYDNAVVYLEQGVKMVSNNPQLKGSFYSSLGGAYNALGDFENSDKAFDSALSLNPNDDITLNNYSYYLSLRKANLDKALLMVEGIVQRNPENSTYLDTYSWVLYQLQNYEEAKRVIELVIRNNEPSAVNYDHYGDILFKFGDVAGAVSSWEKAKSLNSSIENIDRKIKEREIVE
jgi:tetratricopeptide (TPR) repeat protein